MRVNSELRIQALERSLKDAVALLDDIVDHVGFAPTGNVVEDERQDELIKAHAHIRNQARRLIN